MPKKSMEKPRIEKQQEKIEELKETDDLRKRYLTEEDIKKIEIQELKETKERIWPEKPEEKTEAEKKSEEDLDVAREKLIKELAKGESADEDESSSAKASPSASSEAMEDKTEDKEKKRGKQEELPDTFKRIKKESEEKKHLDTTEQGGHIDATTQGERFDIAKQEQKKAEKKFENLKQMELKQDLLTALDKPIENLVENDANIKKCGEKLEELEGKWFKKEERKKIQTAKGVGIERKKQAKQAIADIENKYILEGLSDQEIRRIIIEKVKEVKGKGQEKTTLELREPRENIDATGQENFDTTKHLNATGRGQHLDTGKQKQKMRLDRDKIKRGAIKAGRGAKTGASLFGLFALTVTGAWLSFSSAVVEWAKKNNIKMP
jgi:hypothetical protein